MKLCSLLAALLMGVGASSSFGVDHDYQSCADPLGGSCPSVAINDFQTSELTINVPSDASGNYITNISAEVWITHTYQGDLTVQLVSPAGTTVTLVDRPGGGGFSANDFGFTFTLSPPPTLRLATMYFDDNPTNVSHNFVYDGPSVPSPGWNGAQDPAIIFPLGSAGYLPRQPLAAFNGESKTGPWRLRVTDSATSDTGLLRFFRIHISSVPIGQPMATITSPIDFVCTCNPAQIIGTAADPAVGLSSYTLEWASSVMGSWNLITMSGTPVTNGVLGTWITLSAGEGYRYLRLTATNILGLSTTFTTVVYVDQSFSGLAVSSPSNGSYWSGTVCITGSATDPCFSNYRVEYATPPTFSVYQPVNGGPPVYTTQVVNGTLALWNVSALADGTYRVRVTGTDSCGHTASMSRDVIVDNTRPVAVITSPPSCARRNGSNVTIVGTASDANFDSYTVEYTGGPAHIWVPIATSSSPVVSGTLATWNIASLPPCAYTVRIIARDLAAIGCCGPGTNSTEYTISINLGCAADLDDGSSSGNSDGGVGIEDLLYFLLRYDAGC